MKKNRLNKFLSPLTGAFAALLISTISLVAWASPSIVCGNGVVEEGETCDDGNDVNYDGCASNCKAETGYTCKIKNQCNMITNNEAHKGLQYGEQCDNGADPGSGYSCVQCSKVINLKERVGSLEFLSFPKEGDVNNWNSDIKYRDSSPEEMTVYIRQDLTRRDPKLFGYPYPILKKDIYVTNLLTFFKDIIRPYDVDKDPFPTFESNINKSESRSTITPAAWHITDNDPESVSLRTAGLKKPGTEPNNTGFFILNEPVLEPGQQERILEIQLSGRGIKDYPDDDMIGIAFGIKKGDFDPTEPKNKLDSGTAPHYMLVQWKDTTQEGIQIVSPDVGDFKPCTYDSINGPAGVTLARVKGVVGWQTLWVRPKHICDVTENIRKAQPLSLSYSTDPNYASAIQYQVDNATEQNKNNNEYTERQFGSYDLLAPSDRWEGSTFIPYGCYTIPATKPSGFTVVSGDPSYDIIKKYFFNGPTINKFRCGMPDTGHQLTGTKLTEAQSSLARLRIIYSKKRIQVWVSRPRQSKLNNDAVTYRLPANDKLPPKDGNDNFIYEYTKVIDVTAENNGGDFPLTGKIGLMVMAQSDMKFTFVKPDISTMPICHAERCGDGIVAFPEVCESKNEQMPVFCNDKCQLRKKGDKKDNDDYTYNCVEEKLDPVTHRSYCANAVPCGDGKIENQSVELCESKDDGTMPVYCDEQCNIKPGFECTHYNDAHKCDAFKGCGDGIINGDEQCDPGNGDWSSCSKVSCILIQPGQSKDGYCDTGTPQHCVNVTITTPSKIETPLTPGDNNKDKIKFKGKVGGSVDKIKFKITGPDGNDYSCTTKEVSKPHANSWSYECDSAPKTPGTYTVIVTADGNGGTDIRVGSYIFVVPDRNPKVTVDKFNNKWTNNKSPSITGEATEAAKIHVVIKNKGTGNIVCSELVNVANGKWKLPKLPQGRCNELEEGNRYEVDAIPVDNNNIEHTKQKDTTTFRVDTQNPVTTPIYKKDLPASSFIATGSDTPPIVSTLVSSSHFYFKVESDGDTDPNNESPVNDNVQVRLFKGTGENLAPFCGITPVTVQKQPSGEYIVDGNRLCNSTGQEFEENETYTLVVTATDKAGNQGKPQIPFKYAVASAVPNRPPQTTSENDIIGTPTELTGVADGPNVAKVKVSITHTTPDGNSTTTYDCSSPVDVVTATSKWKVDLSTCADAQGNGASTAFEKDGKVTITATPLDASGNDITGSNSGTITLTKTTIDPPMFKSVTQVNGNTTSFQDGTNQTDPKTVTTDIPNPVIQGTAGGDVDKVEISYTTPKGICKRTVTVTNDNWKFLPNSKECNLPYTTPIDITIISKKGKNISKPTKGQITVTTSSTPSEPTLVAVVEVDGTVKYFEGTTKTASTSDPNPVIKGNSTDPKISYKITDSQHELVCVGDNIDVINNSWSITCDNLSDGTYDIEVTGKNNSTPIKGKINVQLTPNATITTLINDNDGVPTTITGTLNDPKNPNTPGKVKVVITDDNATQGSKPLCEAVVDSYATGQWTFNVKQKCPGLKDDGDYHVTATPADKNGDPINNSIPDNKLIKIAHNNNGGTPNNNGGTPNNNGGTPNNNGGTPNNNGGTPNNNGGTPNNGDTPNNGGTATATVDGQPIQDNVEIEVDSDTPTFQSDQPTTPKAKVYITLTPVGDGNPVTCETEANSDGTWSTNNCTLDEEEYKVDIVSKKDGKETSIGQQFRIVHNKSLIVIGGCSETPTKPTGLVGFLLAALGMLGFRRRKE